MSIKHSHLFCRAAHTEFLDPRNQSQVITEHSMLHVIEFIMAYDCLSLSFEDKTRSEVIADDIVSYAEKLSHAWHNFPKKVDADFIDKNEGCDAQSESYHNNLLRASQIFLEKLHELDDFLSHDLSHDRYIPMQKRKAFIYIAWK